MPDFISLTCPTCGGKLQITNDIERFACGHCGNEHVVRKMGGVISVAPVIEELKGVKTGVDKTASELAIARLEREIINLEKENQETISSITDAINYQKRYMLNLAPSYKWI